MPLIFLGKIKHKKGNRRKHFDAYVAKIVPIIVKQRGEGVKDIRSLVQRLNAEGIPAPSGGTFSYGTTRRVLLRAKELGLADGPRSLSSAASQRPYKARTRGSMSAKQKEALAKLLAALPLD
jgi:hypothetical protein